MALAPMRDRTISLTLASDLTSRPNQKIGVDDNNKFVNRFLPNTGVLGFVQRTLSPSVVLQGPTRINIGLRADHGDDPGINTSFIQPWFIKNVPIRIDGESYLGAYLGVSAADKDAESLLKKFRQTLNDFTRGGAHSRERILLEIKGGPDGSRRFMGYIRNLDLSEDVRNPYFLNYSMEFLGRDIDNSAISTGKEKGIQATNTATGKG